MIIELNFKSGKKEIIEVREQNFGVIIIEQEGEPDRTFRLQEDHEVKGFRPYFVFVEVGFVVVKTIANSEPSTPIEPSPKTA